MRHFSIAKIFASGAVLALSLTVARAADDLPKAESLIDKYIAATGGKAAYEKHHTEMQKGSIEITALGIKGTVTAYKAEPEQNYTEIELAGLGKMREGSDGKVFWEISAMAGPRVKEGGEKAQAQTVAHFNPELHWRENFKEAKTTGVDTVDGKECYKVSMTPKEGSPIVQCYDKASGLLVKTTMTAESPMGTQTVDSFASDYRKEGDMLVAHKIKQSIAGQDIAISIDSVSYNVEIPKDTFALPDEVKALVNKK